MKITHTDDYVLYWIVGVDHFPNSDPFTEPVTLRVVPKRNILLNGCEPRNIVKEAKKKTQNKQTEKKNGKGKTKNKTNILQRGLNELV